MTASIASTNLAAALRPLAEAAAQYREECSTLERLVEELYRDVEQLREELVKRGDEVEEGRRKLAQRGAQLAEQRKESGRLVQLVQQQETRMAEALTEIKGLREQLTHERDQAQQRDSGRIATLEQELRAAQAERDQMRHELSALQAAAMTGGGASAEGLVPLMAELGELRRQLTETQSQLGEARTQVAEAIERAAKVHAAPTLVAGDAPAGNADTMARLSEAERQRIELESELELVRTRATELQEVVSQQRRELVEQRADVTTELRLLRELVEQRPQRSSEAYEAAGETALVGATSRGEPEAAAPDPVVSSVMAQFARLQKDVAQRRKKK